MQPLQRWKYRTIGTCFLLTLAMVTALAIAQYNRAFEETIPITIKADRSGLLMEQGAVVKVRGVQVGRVADVRTDDSGALLSVDLEPEELDRIPAEPAVRLIPTTVFGAKYVELRQGNMADSMPHIQAGDVIKRAAVTVELNATFDAVLRTLHAMPAEKLNGALTAMADALRGNGHDAGELITTLDSYLRVFNPNLPELGKRWPQLTGVAKHYRAITDDLTTAAGNFGYTSGTLVEREQALKATLRSLTVLGDSMSTFLRRNGESLVETLDVLLPTTRLLARYSPILPCFLGGVVRTRDIMLPIMRGASAQVTITSLPGIPPYQYPDDLATKGLDTGPDCHGLPDVDGRPPYVSYDTGANPYPNHADTTSPSGKPLALLLFGPLSPMGGGR